MKVLHVITGLNVGGAEAMLGRLIACGHLMPDVQSEVLSLMAPGVAGERMAASGATIHSLNMRAGVPSLPAAVRLVALSRKIRPDLIMGWMHHGQIAASVAARVAPGRPQALWNVRHSLSGFAREKPLSRALLRVGGWLSWSPAAIVYNSMAAQRQYAAFGYRPKRDLVIPNGFDRSGFAPRAEARSRILKEFGISDAALVCGMIARNHPMKDLPNLLSAFARVHEENRHVHLLIVGHQMDTPSPGVARQLAALPSESWTISGHRSDVAKWLAGIDIAVLPSAWGEGFPNVIGEAMAARVACIATDVGDSAWAIGNAGRIVDPGDSAALASAMLDLARIGSEGRQAIGDAAARRIDEHFTLESVVGRYAALFRAHARRSAPVPGETMAHAGHLR